MSGPSATAPAPALVVDTDFRRAAFLESCMMVLAAIKRLLAKSQAAQPGKSSKGSPGSRERRQPHQNSASGPRNAVGLRYFVSGRPRGTSKRPRKKRIDILIYFAMWKNWIGFGEMTRQSNQSSRPQEMGEIAQVLSTTSPSAENPWESKLVAPPRPEGLRERAAKHFGCCEQRKDGVILAECCLTGIQGDVKVVTTRIFCREIPLRITLSSSMWTTLTTFETWSCSKR